MIFDLDKPYVPCEMEDLIGVKSHMKQGQFEWDPAKVEIVDALALPQLLKKQKEDAFVKEAAKLKVANASLAFHLMNNKHLIPREWVEEEDRSIAFLGTVFENEFNYHGCIVYLEYCLYEHSQFSDSDEPKWDCFYTEIHEYRYRGCDVLVFK